MKKILALFLLLIPSLAFGQGGFNPIGATKVVFTGAGSSTTNTTTITSGATAAYSLLLPTGLPAGSGYYLTSDASGNLTWTNSATAGVSSWSGGTTGLLPSSATTGAVTLSGVLVIANGGTNSSTALSGNSIMISNGSAIVQGAAGTTTTLLHGNAAGSPSYSAVSLTADVTGILPLANGGTNANLTASNGGIFYSTGSAGAILAGTATARQILMSGASATPAWSTATYPATTTINQLLYSSAANTIDGITTANNELLVTNGSGVPSWSTTLPSGVTGYVSSITNSDGTLTISPTSGAAIASLALGHANTWTGNQTINANVTHGSGTILTAQTVTTLAANTNNLALPTKTYAYIAASTPGFNLTGIAAGVDGQMLVLVNPGAFPITLVEQSSLSTSGNRFLFSSTIGGTNNVILAPQAAIVLIYDNTNAFNSITGYWRFVAHN